MSALANLYPGHLVVELFVIVAAAVTFLSAAAWVGSLFLGRHPALRHCVLLSALVASLASLLLTSAFVASGKSFIAVPWIAAVESPRGASGWSDGGRPSDFPPSPTAPEIIAPESAPIPAVALPSADNLDGVQTTPTALVTSVTPTNPFRSAVVAILLLWLCGIVVSIVGLARGGLLLHRLRRSLQPVCDVELGTDLDDVKRLFRARTSPTVMVSRLARSPMAAGLFRPVIVLPAGLTRAISREQLRDVLLHELAHIERLDNLVLLLQSLAKTAFWPILFVHLLNRQLARAREDICDNHVLACRDAVNYGETLLRLAQLACGGAIPAGTVGILHWRGKLEERIVGLIHQRRSKMTQTPPLIAVSILVLFLSTSAILCATTIIEAREGDQKPSPIKAAEPETAAETRGVVRGDKTKVKPEAPRTDRLASAPKIIVYGTGNRNLKASGPSASLRLISAEGKELNAIAGLKQGESIGGNHCVSIDRQRERIYFCENGAARLTAIDLMGKVMWQIEKIDVKAIAVDSKSGNIWCEVGNSLDDMKTIVVSVDGKVVTEYPWGGVDIAYDPQVEAFWIAGYQIMRIDRQGKMSLRRPLPDLPGLPEVPTVVNARNWCAVSISPDKLHEVGSAHHGGAWVAIRSHPNVTGSRNRLVRLDDKGETRALVELADVDPFAVACDAVGNCWVVDRGKGLLQFNIDGQVGRKLPMSAFAVAGDREEGGAWVSTDEEVIRLDKQGGVIWRYKLGYRSTQTWLGTSEF